MPESDLVTRGEFDLLKQIVADNQMRLLSIDEHGTRGVGIVQVQLNEVIKDLADLKLSHEQEKQARRTTGKWLVGTIIAFMVMAATVLGTVVQLASTHGH